MLTKGKNQEKRDFMKAYKLLEEIKCIDHVMETETKMTPQFREKLKARRKRIRAAISWTPKGPIITATDEEMESLKEEITKI